MIGPSLNGFDSKEQEAGSSLGELQGTDVLVHRMDLEKSEGEKKVKLVVDKNPFFDDDEDSQTEEEMKDRNMQTLGNEELPAESQVPAKPRRGILRSTEDLNRMSNGEEILPQNGSEKNSTELVETNVIELMAVESTSITDEVAISSPPSNGDGLQNETGTFQPKIEVEDVAENETWEEELEENSSLAKPQVSETREVVELTGNETRNQEERSYTTTHDEESRGEIEISREIEMEGNDKLSTSQTIEEIGVEEISVRREIEVSKEIEMEENNKVSEDQTVKDIGAEEASESKYDI